MTFAPSDIEDEDYKPTSCEDIKLMGQGDVDAYYVIFPRGACGDSVKVWCSGMSTLTPREYIDVDPDLNLAVYAGLDAPCLKLLIFRGKSSFNKVGNFLYCSICVSSVTCHAYTVPILYNVLTRLYIAYHVLSLPYHVL